MLCMHSISNAHAVFAIRQIEDKRWPSWRPLSRRWRARYCARWGRKCRAGWQYDAWAPARVSRHCRARRRPRGEYDASHRRLQTRRRVSPTRTQVPGVRSGQAQCWVLAHMALWLRCWPPRAPSRACARARAQPAAGCSRYLQTWASKRALESTVLKLYQLENKQQKT